MSEPEIPAHDEPRALETIPVRPDVARRREGRRLERAQIAAAVERQMEAEARAAAAGATVTELRPGHRKTWRQRRRERKQGRPKIKWLRLLAIGAGLGLLATVSTLFGMVMALAADLPDLQSRPTERNTTITDLRGRSLGLLTGQEQRILVSSQDIPKVVRDAIIAIEDRRFYENEGVDLRGVARALYQDIVERRIVQGGSTITQQFVKNATEAQDDRTLFTKAREAALAFHLTRKWSKEKILREYLNTIYYGNGAYGIESAARVYFGRAHPGCGERGAQPCVSLLEPHEAALIAAVVANPTAYDPVTNPREATDRRNLVMDRMRAQGYLSDLAYRRGLAEAIPGPLDVVPPQEKTTYPYFTTWVKQQVVDRVGAKRAFGGGLTVRTTLDSELQEAAQGAVDRLLPPGSGLPRAAMVVIDNKTGEVRAMVGGDAGPEAYQRSAFNLATQGRRQPGSAFKPFILAAALQKGISPNETFPSRKVVFTVPGTKGREKFEVNNYEDSYAGVATLAQATTSSDNAVYAQLGINRVGTRKVARLARRLGIRTPVSSNYAMTLGGLRQGVTVLDMAHAYHSLARGGKLVYGTLSPGVDRPTPGPAGIRMICEGQCPRRGDDGVLAANEVRAKRVLPEGAARTTGALLQNVVKFGTGKRAAIPKVAVAGKTGTTENYGDAWFVGWTRLYTVAVWVGYPDELRFMETEFGGDPVAGGTYPAMIFKDVMTAAHALDAQRNPKKKPKDDTGADGAAAPATGGAAATTPSAPATPGDGGEEPAARERTREPRQTEAAPPAETEAPEPEPPEQQAPEATPAPAPPPPAPPAGGAPAPAGGTGAPPPEQ